MPCQRRSSLLDWRPLGRVPAMRALSETRLVVRLKGTKMRSRWGVAFGAAMWGIVAVSGWAADAPLYKCTDRSGRTEFSDRPCGANAKVVGSVQKYTDEEVAETNRQRDTAERAFQQQYRQEQLRQREAAALVPQPTYAAPTPGARPLSDSSMNERVMVHTPRGWDYKTRAQIIAEEQARAARASTRRAAPSTFVDQYGQTWINNGATAFNPTTGRTCSQSGGVLVGCN